MRGLSILFILLACIAGLLSACGGGTTQAQTPAELSLSIDLKSLPSATVSEPYNQTVVMTAASGTSSYFYDCRISDDGAAGITAVAHYGGPTNGSVSCFISGIPVASGTLTVSFSVTDTTTFSSVSAGPLSLSINPPSNPLDNWQLRYSLPEGNNLAAAAYGAGFFAAVGEKGVILTSSDGTEWTPVISGTANDLRAVTYGNGIFVAVGDNGTILTSPDGVLWTGRESGINDAILTGVSWGNDVFVAVGYGPMLISRDGVTWTTILANTGLSGVTYGNGRFIAVGYGAVLTSSDGVLWSTTTFLSFPALVEGNYGLSGVTYGNGTYVIVGFFRPINTIHGAHEARIFTSPDGVNWTQQTAKGTLGSVTYGNGVFLIVGDSASGYTDPRFATIYSSPDGVTWTERFVQKEMADGVFLVGSCYGNGTFVAVGGNKILQSGSL